MDTTVDGQSPARLRDVPILRLGQGIDALSQDVHILAPAGGDVRQALFDRLPGGASESRESN